MTPMTLPRWLPAAAALAFIAWAVTIWWMVATLPAGASEPDTALADVIAEVERLNGEVEALTQQIAALEASPAPVATPAPSPAFETMDVDTASLAASPSDAEATPAVSPFFTDGKDRYNCRDFSSYADAQEALRVNRPGDPNRIDMNGNNEACEDFAYPDRPRGTAPSTPTATATPRATATPAATATPRPSN
ncbi:MAG: hypothetical protein AMXMBFR23_21960 [Chloroflexota bacterium]